MPDEVVYVIDDDESVRRALCRLLASVDLPAEGFPSAEAFLEKPLPEQPSCLVLDLNLGNGLSGLALQAELRDRQYVFPILFISGTTNFRGSVAAMKAGAFDFLEKPIDQEVFLTRVRDALAVSRQSLQEQAERNRIESRLARLTPRERQVLWLVVRGGLTNRQMATELGTALKTIKVHRGRLTRKMRTDSVPALIKMILRLSEDQARRWFGDEAAALMTNWKGRTPS